MSARTPKYSCAPPRGEPEADEDLVEDQHDPAFAAHRAQFAQPVAVRGAVEVGAAPAVDQRRVSGRADVRMQRLQRIDQHAGDVAPAAEHPQGRLVHVLQRVGVARRERIADARLHVAPPAVVGAAKAHQVAAARVVSGEPHGLHDRLGSRHVKGDLVQAGDFQQAAHVVGGHRMVGAQHRARARGRARCRARCTPCRNRSRTRSRRTSR